MGLKIYIQITIQHSFTSSPLYSKNDVNQNSVVFSPYIWKVTHRSSSFLRKYKVKPPSKIYHLFPSPNESSNNFSCEGMCSILFSRDAVYIDKTGRLAKTRLVQHQKCLPSGRLTKSAVVLTIRKQGITYSSKSICCVQVSMSCSTKIP